MLLYVFIPTALNYAIFGGGSSSFEAVVSSSSSKRMKRSHSVCTWNFLHCDEWSCSIHAFRWVTLQPSTMLYPSIEEASYSGRQENICPVAGRSIKRVAWKHSKLTEQDKLLLLYFLLIDFSRRRCSFLFVRTNSHTNNHKVSVWICVSYFCVCKCFSVTFIFGIFFPSFQFALLLTMHE